MDPESSFLSPSAFAPLIEMDVSTVAPLGNVRIRSILWTTLLIVAIGSSQSRLISFAEEVELGKVDE
jgi:hypothetical protein